MSRCPVCGAEIPPLAEDCVECYSSWTEGQSDCPAYFDPLDANCEVGFRHKGKHRSTAVTLRLGKRYGEEPNVEGTISWHYPQNNPSLMRSEDYRRRHVS